MHLNISSEIAKTYIMSRTNNQIHDEKHKEIPTSDLNDHCLI